MIGLIRSSILWIRLGLKLLTCYNMGKKKQKERNYEQDYQRKNRGDKRRSD